MEADMNKSGAAVIFKNAKTAEGAVNALGGLADKALN
jgi:hypothetical protein